MSAKRKFTTWLATLAVFALVGPSIANAEELSYSELVSRLEALESQLDNQQAEFASFNLGGGTQKYDDGCGKGGKGGCGPQRSVYGSYELTVLQPQISVPLLGLGFGDDYLTGHRLILGAENSNGIGGRIRYWTFDQSINAVTGPPVTVAINMDVLDGEVTMREHLCSFDMLLSGGFRYGRAGFSPAGPQGNGPGEFYYEGIGPTVALEAQRHFGDRGLYLIGNFRGSQLFGQISNNNNGPITDDELYTVLESQLGLGWSRQMNRGILDLRAVWENQSWLNDNFPGSNFGFTGFTLGAQVRL